MSYSLGYDPCLKCDRKMCSMCELTYHRNKQFIDDRICSIDACTAYSRKVNVVIVEE